MKFQRSTVIKAVIILCLLAAFIVLACIVTNNNPEADSRYEQTFMALVPPILAIALALITKEVYSSLFIGIVVGALLGANFSPIGTLDSVINNGIIPAVADNAGIFIFLVVLGILVALINATGGSQAFGRWAKKHIKTRAGALIATFFLGVFIFIDDYFNCLTVGSVMQPVTDSHKVSRVKLAYLIDATAAPVCMIAPISSWAAAVSEYVENGQGLKFFCLAIPFNFYSLLTLVFIIALAVMGYDYGKMAWFEDKAEKGDLSILPTAGATADEGNSRGKVIDLILPIVVLIVACVLTLMYVGGFFDAESDCYHNLIDAFGNTDATVGLPMGSIIALIIVMIYYVARRLLSFRDMMEQIPKGFIAMVPAILILTFATSLKNMTGILGAKYYVADLVARASGILWVLPLLIFAVACGLAFATGTSWGTFGILIPIVSQAFGGMGSTISIICMSACLAGAVCGDHCSPISDTTIMASAGANCNHLDHVSTQLPYAITVAGISAFGYLLTGILYQFAGIQEYYLCAIVLPICIVLTVAGLFVLRALTKKTPTKTETTEQ